MTESPACDAPLLFCIDRTEMRLYLEREIGAWYGHQCDMLDCGKAGQALAAEALGNVLRDVLGFAEALPVYRVPASDWKDAEITRLKGLINTPHTNDWFEAVRLEAAHQVDRWGVNHDLGKTGFDWFWLIGYVAQKAAASAVAGDDEKAKHHTVSTGAVLLNWFRHITGDAKLFQPGVDALVKEGPSWSKTA